MRTSCAAFIALVLLSLSLSLTPPAQSRSVRVQGCPSACSCSPDQNPAHPPPGLTVDCSGQSLDHIPQDVPAEATTLLLSGNRLARVPDDVFGHLTQLRELNLSFNVIELLQGNAFRGLGKLVELDLHRNKLSLGSRSYPDDVFLPLVSLAVLKLQGNVWRASPASTSPRPTPSSLPQSPPIIEANDDLLFASRESQPDLVGHRQPEATGGFRDSPTTGLSKLRGHSAGRLPAKNSRNAGWTGYPDTALSHLHNLRKLTIDGLPNKTLGPGFKNLTHLTLLRMYGKANESTCRLGTLNTDTFTNVPTVRNLYLTNCDITDLTADTFSSLVVLDILDLSYNEELGFDLLGKAFFGLSRTRVRSLIIDAVVPGRALGVYITAEQLRYFGNLTHLEELQARFNRLRGFHIRALCVGMPPKLTHVNVNGNMFELAPYVNDMGCLGNLQQLDMNGFDGYWIPPLRPPDREAPGHNHHKQLAKRSVHRKTSETMQVPSPTTRCKEVGKQFSVPPNLETFTAVDFGLLYKLQKVRINPDNRLKRIDVSRNHFPELIGPLSGFGNVTELIFAQTTTEYADKEFFSSFPSLEILDIGRNNLGDVFRHDTKGVLLRDLKNLKKLDLSWNTIGRISAKTILPLENLEELDIAGNGIGTFTLDLSRMKKLRRLNISKNPMHSIPKPARDDLDRISETHNVTINMTFNPISCMCKNIDFLKWMRDSEVYFGTHENYFCQAPDGNDIYMDDIIGVINDLERSCGNYVGVFVGALASSLTVVALLVVALAYRFRWKLRYLYYASRLGLQRQSRRKRQQAFHYDAFVSFASEDDDFVHGELKRRLEDDFGLKLCIHTRDFVPGAWFTNNKQEIF